MASDSDQLREMPQGDKESFKEYMQRWREVAAQVVPPIGEQEMTKVFLKTLGLFYYERMVSSAPSDFTDMVSMGVCLEEAVREGRLTKDEGTKKSRTGSFERKKVKRMLLLEKGRLDQLEGINSTNNRLLL